MIVIQASHIRTRVCMYVCVCACVCACVCMRVCVCAHARMWPAWIRVLHAAGAFHMCIWVHPHTCLNLIKRITDQWYHTYTRLFLTFTADKVAWTLKQLTPSTCNEPIVSEINIKFSVWIVWIERLWICHFIIHNLCWELLKSAKFVRINTE